MTIVITIYKHFKLDVYHTYRFNMSSGVYAKSQKVFESNDFLFLLDLKY